MIQTSDEFTTTTFKLPSQDLKAFDEVAKERRTSRAALLRECVLEKIESGATRGGEKA